MLSLELGIVTILIVVNGLLAMSELAIVSSRPARLAALVEKRVTGSRRALTLASDPGKFLSTVQIGITLIGIMAGAYSGSSLGGPVGARLQWLGVSPRIIAETMSRAWTTPMISSTEARPPAGACVASPAAARGSHRRRCRHRSSRHRCAGS